MLHLDFRQSNPIPSLQRGLKTAKWGGGRFHAQSRPAAQRDQRSPAIDRLGADHDHQPGWDGWAFLHGQHDKIHRLRTLLAECELSIPIVVDDGIDTVIAPLAGIAPLPPKEGDCGEAIAAFERASMRHQALTQRLKEEGAEPFSQFWEDLLLTLSAKNNALNH